MKQPDAGDGSHTQNALIKPPQLTREMLPHQERINKTIPADAGDGSHTKNQVGRMGRAVWAGVGRVGRAMWGGPMGCLGFFNA